MHFWDYDTGYCFQKDSTTVQPGSLDGEAGIYACTYDRSGRWVYFYFYCDVLLDFFFDIVLLFLAPVGSSLAKQIKPLRSGRRTMKRRQKHTPST
jgi:hypothetical protein